LLPAFLFIDEEMPMDFFREDVMVHVFHDMWHTLKKGSQHTTMKFLF
jgi:hypothetical protein